MIYKKPQHFIYNYIYNLIEKMPNRKNELWKEVKQSAPKRWRELLLDRKINYRTSTIVSLTNDLAQLNNRI